MTTLKGQVALITGSSSGIGRGTALAMARAGADVIVNYVGGEAAAGEVVAEIEALGQRAIAIRADVSVEAEVQAMFAQAIDTFGAIDTLVANAGIQRDAAFVDLTIEQWNQVIAVNLTGQFLCAREAVRHYLAREPRPAVSRARGKVICVSSVHEIVPWAGHVNYAASKGGVMLMMKSLAQEVGAQNIRVNSIAPGAIRTPINKDAWDSPEDVEALHELIPQNRIGEVEDVGNLAVFLASDAADYIHGASLLVDGGMALYPGFENGEG